MHFLYWNLKLSVTHPVLLIEASLSPIESTSMTKYLLCKNKLNNMEDKRLPKIALNSS
jgi:hypothetical protein